MSLSGKNIIVTEGTIGIGKEIVKYLASKGANVIFTYSKDRKSAKLLENECFSYERRIQSFQLDEEDFNHIANFIKCLDSCVGSIDVVINNIHHNNLTSISYISKVVMPYMIKKRKGRIVNISSGEINYSSQKTEILEFTKTLAKGVAPYGIAVNTIAPGLVDTEILLGLSKDKKKELFERIPAIRVSNTRSVPIVIGFLADDELSPDYLTGQIMFLKGLT